MARYTLIDSNAAVPPAPMAPPPPTASHARNYAPRHGMRGSSRHDGREGLYVTGRNGELLTRSNRTNARQDQFDLPLSMVRDAEQNGYTYQWQPVTCYGQELPAQVNAMLENGWRAVPSLRCDGWYHPKGYQGPIVRDGQMLMERPIELTQQAINDGIRAAKGDLYKQQLSFQGADDIVDKVNEMFGVDTGIEPASGENDSRGWAKPKFKRRVEAVPGSMYPQRTRETSLTMGDDD